MLIDQALTVARELVDALAQHDRESAEHCRRVGALALRFAGEAALELHSAEAYLAGLLHDVGKCSVPLAILRAPRRLTPEEDQQMRRHVECGVHLLLPWPELGAALPGVRHHHERWDGSGYPCRLAHQQIPLTGRVLAICDAYDAMTRSRPYAAAVDHWEAILRLAHGAGAQFDPELTAQFVAISPERLWGDAQQGTRKWR